MTNAARFLTSPHQMADRATRGMTCRWLVGVLGLPTFVLAACSSGLIGGTATMPTVDPRAAFGVFARLFEPAPRKLLDLESKRGTFIAAIDEEPAPGPSLD